MKVGDMIRIETWRSQGEPDKIGLIVAVQRLQRNNKRVATVMIDGEIMTWPLDSHYEIEVISEVHD